MGEDGDHGRVEIDGRAERGREDEDEDGEPREEDSDSVCA